MSRRGRWLASIGAVLVAGGVAAAALFFAFGDATAGPAQIAFERGEGLNPAIHLIAEDGTAERELVPYGSGPRWSPGGHRVAFVVHSPPEDVAPLDELWVVAADGSDARRAARDASIRTIAWSPDGARIAWIGASRAGAFRLSAVDLGTGARLTIPTQLFGPTSLDWSPDGRELLTVDGGNVVTVNLASGRKHTLRAGAAAFEAFWSPDAARIAFVAEPERRALARAGGIQMRLERSIFVMDADGSNVRRLTRGALDSSPSWAPAGDAIVFARTTFSSDPVEVDSTLHVVRPGDAEPSRVTRGTDDGAPDWRPAGRPEPAVRIARAPLPEPSVEVPDLEDLGPWEATRALEEAGLTAVVRAVGGTRPRGGVLAQSPAPGARVPPGTAVVVAYSAPRP